MAAPMKEDSLKEDVRERVVTGYIDSFRKLHPD